MVKRREFITHISALLGVSACGGNEGEGEAGRLEETAGIPRPGSVIPPPAPSPAPPPAPEPEPVPEPQPVPAPGSLPVFGIVSARGGADLPFAFGHVFRQGDVPAGRSIDSDLARWQAVPTSRWPDGSVRHAIIAGLADCTAGALKPIRMSIGAARTGTLDLPLPNVVLQAGSKTITLAQATLHRTVCAGPVMVNRIYQHDISDHLVAYFDVRIFKGGAVEIFPWIENGFLYVAEPTNDVRMYTLTINGATRFSSSIDVKHHTRVALIDNRASTFRHWSYWAGVDPQIEPRHDTGYMMASKMVPHYGWTTNGSTLARLLQDYHPNSMGSVQGTMGSSNHLSFVGIIPPWAAAFVAGRGDPRGYRAVVMNGIASGAWPIHYRDEATHEPLKFGHHPDIWVAQSNPAKRPPRGTGGVNKDAGGRDAVPDISHQPSLAYLPWLLTGRWFFLDEMMFWSTWSYFNLNYVEREGADCVQFISTQRSRARFLRTAAHILACLPADHPCFPDYLNVWEKNMKAHHERYITGTRDGGRYLNHLGSLATYTGRSKQESAYFTGNTGGYFWDPPWQIVNMTLALAIAWDLNLPQSRQSHQHHHAVLHFGYKLPVGFAGDGSPGTYYYRRFPLFEMPIGTDEFGIPPDRWLPDLGAVYVVSEANGMTGTTPMPPLPAGKTLVYKDKGPISASYWSSHSAVIYSYACLAMAVEHRAEGASEAWARIIGSDSWALAPQAFRANPTWGFYPRAL